MPNMVLEQNGLSLSAGVKILDFGLARFTENYGEATVATEVGVVQGSITVHQSQAAVVRAAESIYVAMFTLSEYYIGC